MFALIGGKGTGKTTKLIEQAHKESLYIIVHSRGEATRLFHEAIRIGMKVKFPLTYSEFMSQRSGGVRINGFLIDNIEFFLQEVAQGIPVIGFSGDLDSVAISGDEISCDPIA